MTEHFPILVVIIPLSSSFIIFLFRLTRYRYEWHLSTAATFLSFLISLSLLNTVLRTGAFSYRLGDWAPPWGIEYRVDYLSGFMLVIVALVVFVTSIYAGKSVKEEIGEEGGVPFFALYTLLSAGLFGIILTGDMFNLYVFLEITSLSAYALVGVGRKRRAIVAGFNYLILGSIGACLYLLSVGYLYIMTGSLNMADLAQLLPNLYGSNVVIVGFVFFVVGLALKMALFPLHTWLPDAYTYAPSTVSALIAPTMTKVGAYVMIRVMFTVFKPYFVIELIPVTTILAWIAAVAMIVGSIFAIIQSDLKKMLSYSVVAQIGYIMLGVGLANRLGLTGAILHILNEALTKGVMFSVAGAIVYKLGTSDIYRFTNLYKKMPLTMAAFLIGAFSMVGIPPTCGFFSKLYLILGAIEAKQWVFVAVLLVSSLLNVIYFFRVIEIAYFKPRELATKREQEALKVVYVNGGQYEETATETGSIHMDEVPLSMLIPILLMAAGILVSGMFYFDIIDRVIQFAVPSGI
jgi:multicomponent Na+:H+ antiporter subunit D